MIPSRRARITEMSQIALTATEAASRIRAVAAAPLPGILAETLDSFLAAAESLAQVAEAEIRPLDECRDLDGSGS